MTIRREDKTAGFADLHPPLNPLRAVVEAARCLYCYDAPCVQACPTAIDIPKFIHQISTGNLDGSARTILSANIMGGTCARACPTEILCEQDCVLNAGEDQPVAIGLLQRHAVDHRMARAGHPFSRAAATGKRIAVVGAGPAGLSCAHRLAMLGHDVRVYEARQKPGGLNEYGIAAYKMVDDFAQKEVRFLLDIGGIEIEYGARLGDNLSLADLRRDHDAVFLGLGLGRAGAVLEGGRDALEFIAELRQAADPACLDVPARVVVIGGGNTAIDAAVQARRLGARDVTLVYRRGLAEMSATPWEQDLARTEGVVIRLWAQPVAIDEGGAVFEATALEAGSLIATGELFRIDCDLVLKATGQRLDPTGLDELAPARGKIPVDAALMTALPGVFAGGDCVATGQDLTVQAVEDGKRAAIAIDAYLNRGNERK